MAEAEFFDGLKAGKSLEDAFFEFTDRSASTLEVLLARLGYTSTERWRLHGPLLAAVRERERAAQRDALSGSSLEADPSNPAAQILYKTSLGLSPEEIAEQLSMSEMAVRLTLAATPGAEAALKSGRQERRSRASRKGIQARSAARDAVTPEIVLLVGEGLSRGDTLEHIALEHGLSLPVVRAAYRTRYKPSKAQRRVLRGRVSQSCTITDVAKASWVLVQDLLKDAPERIYRHV